MFLRKISFFIYLEVLIRNWTNLNSILQLMNQASWAPLYYKILEEDVSDRYITRKFRKRIKKFGITGGKKGFWHSKYDQESLLYVIYNLFDVDENNKLNQRKLHITKLLFKSNIIDHSMIKDDMLINLFRDFQGLEAQRALIDFLIGLDLSDFGTKSNFSNSDLDQKEIIPMSRFFALKLEEKNGNILNIMTLNNWGIDMCSYFKFFHQKGAKLENCNLAHLTERVIGCCRLDTLKYLISSVYCEYLSKDINKLIFSYIINFNYIDSIYPDGSSYGDIPILLEMVSEYGQFKNIECLNDIKALVEIALDYGYNVHLKDNLGKDLIDYLYLYQYGSFIPDRLRSIYDRRYPYQNLKVNVDQKHLDDVTSTWANNSQEVKDILYKILDEFQIHRFTKDIKIINNCRNRLREIADSLSYNPTIKQIIHKIMNNEYNQFYHFFDDDLSNYWFL